MKKGYYIHFQGRESIGVSKKIDMQLAEFKKHFQIKELEVATPQRSILERIIGLWPTASIKRNYQAALNQLESPDFIYVRRTVADKEYVAFWREIKKRFPDCKIIIEIYTYPYDKDDFCKWNAWPFYFKELIYRKQLKNYIDRFVTYTDDKKIFDVPTICTTNGIICENIKEIEGEYQHDQLHLLGVAYMQRQHGYERVIEGLALYYRNEKMPIYKVYLHLVGDGPEKRKYQRLVRKKHLEKYVKFFPASNGDELDRHYNWADITLAAFGMYKVNYKGPIGALKTRECLAKGLPLISGSSIDILPIDFSYALILANDKTPVDIKTVICFFEKIKENGHGKMEIAHILRKYAEQTVSMKIVMQPIEKYIEMKGKEI